jgi:two-component system NarL family sensor kinase
MNKQLPLSVFLKLIVLVIQWLFICCGADAQTHFIDSLTSRLATSSNDQTKLDNLLAICKESHSLSPVKLSMYAAEAKRLALKNGEVEKKKLADYYIDYGYILRGSLDSCLDLVTRQLGGTSYASDADLYTRLTILEARALNNSNQMKASLSLLFELLKTTEAHEDTLGQVRAMNLMEGAYVSVFEDERAKDWCYRALAVLPANASRDFSMEANIANSNLALCFLHIMENKGINSVALLDSADKYATRAINITKRNEFLNGLAYNLSLRGAIYGYRHNNKAGEEDLLQSLSIYKGTGNNFYIINAMSALGNFYGITNQPLKGIAICKEGIALTGSAAPNFFLYTNLAGCYKLAGDYRGYGNTLSILVSLKDSMYQKNGAEALSKLQAQYEVQKKENTIIQQKLDINKKNNLFYGSLILLVLTLTAASFIFSIRKKNQAMRLGEMQLEVKRKTLEAILQAEENERKRIAADLHDSVAQKMVVAKLNLETLDNYLPDMTSHQRHIFNNILSMVDESCTDVRSLSHSMMPQAFFNSGLSAAVKNLSGKIDSGDLRVNFSAEGDEAAIDKGTQIMAYRIIQECVQNALKHANAQRLDITILFTNGEMGITVEDDGTGFEREGMEEGVGMANIRSRVDFLNGKMDIQSNKETGTAFTFYIPAKKM